MTKKQNAPVPNVATSLRPDLKLDWCSHEAAKYACENFHYSHTVPASRTAKIGVWENGKFIGCVIFGIGSGSATNGVAYGLSKHCDIAELTRVALTSHKTPVSRIIAIALKMLRVQSPNLRMLVSYADPAQGHHGGIYQAGGWIYTGEEKRKQREFLIDGEWLHSRTASGKVKTIKSLPFRTLPKKHRYFMPLDAEMKAKIEPLRKPYPKRAGSVDSLHVG